LLYLDSLDYGGDQCEASEAHHLAEASAALPSLAPDALVLFDDTWPVQETTTDGAASFSGKGARAIPFLLAHGLRLGWMTDGQVLLTWGAGRDP
jgi:hypothetical protein